jgi:hypothetical protein
MRGPTWFTRFKNPFLHGTSGYNQVDTGLLIVDDTPERLYTAPMKVMAPYTHGDLCRDYSEFWSLNLQRLVEVHTGITESIGTLEKHLFDTHPLFRSLEEQISLMMTIYSNFTTLPGGEHIQRLSQLIKTHRRNHTGEMTRFDLMNKCIETIARLRDETFSEFPELYHRDRETLAIRTPSAAPIRRRWPFQWVTFSRHRSWFIKRCRTAEIIGEDDFTIMNRSNPDTLHVLYDKKKLQALDLLAPFESPLADPPALLLVNGGQSVYAVTIPGRHIYSARDFVSPEIRPYRTRLALTPGTFRIFGKKHIVLN